MNKYIADRPWIWLAFSFCVMMAAMAATVVIAVENEPKEVPLDNAPPTAVHASAQAGK